MLEILARIESASPRELSTLIAEKETDQEPPSRNDRHSVYVALKQSHIPKLEESSVVEYDEALDRVTLGTNAKDVLTYLTVGSKSGLSWREFYSMLTLSSIITVLGSIFRVPIIGQFNPLAYLLAVLILFTFSIGYLLWTNRQSAMIWIDSIHD